MLKIRRPLGRLIFNMGIAIPGKTVFLIETAPRRCWANCRHSEGRFRIIYIYIYLYIQKPHILRKSLVYKPVIDSNICTLIRQHHPGSCNLSQFFTTNWASPLLKQEYLRKIRSIHWLLMPCPPLSPKHQQLCYWLCRISKSFSSTWGPF